MNSSRNWGLQIDSAVAKAMKKIPRRDAVAILEVMHLLPADPYFGDIQKMKGSDQTWRRRIDSYRLFYKVDVLRRVVLIFHVERRTSSTY